MAVQLPVAGSAFVAPSVHTNVVRKVGHVGSNAAVGAKSTSYGMTMAGEGNLWGKWIGNRPGSWKELLVAALMLSLLSMYSAG